MHSQELFTKGHDFIALSGYNFEIVLLMGTQSELL